MFYKTLLFLLPEVALRFYKKISSSFDFLLSIKICIYFNLQRQRYFHFSKNWYLEFTFLVSQSFNLAVI